MRHLWGIRISQTVGLTIGLLTFLVGVGFANLGDRISGYAVMVLIILLIAAWRRGGLTLGVCIVAFGFGLGWWRGAQIQQRLTPYQINYGHQVTLTTTVLTDAVYGNNSQLEFDAGSVKFVEPIHQSVPGSLSIKGFGENALYRGDRVQIKGKLQILIKIWIL